MRVRFADSGDAFGSGERWQTCIHVSGDVQMLLVDCDAASRTALRSQGPDPGASTAVAVTHLQATTSAGCRFSWWTAQFSHRTAPLLVARPPGTTGRLVQAMETPFAGSSRGAAPVRREGAPNGLIRA